MDDSIKKLFEDFNPGLSSDADFMKRLNDRLDAVEYIKEKAAADSRRNRLSLWVASLAGFLAGSLTTLAVPYLTRLLASLDIASEYASSIPWIAVAAMAIVSALSVYDLSGALSRLSEAKR